MERKLNPLFTTTVPSPFNDLISQAISGKRRAQNVRYVRAWRDSNS
jgi:hypothetical protein